MVQVTKGEAGVKGSRDFWHGGHNDIGNNRNIRRHGRAPRGRQRLRADHVRGHPAARGRFLQHALRHRRDRQLARLRRQRALRVANLRAWGWITLIIGVLQLAAAAGILAGNQLARWFAVAVVGLNAIDMMFFIPAYPFWALTIIAIDVVALYGLCAYGSRQTWPPSMAAAATCSAWRLTVSTLPRVGY